MDEELKQEIQEGYRRFLKEKQWQPRLGQRQMIATVANTLSSAAADPAHPPICVVEAGTGTGKSLAYLLATLPVARALDKKVVIATATIALQEQLLHRDIPDMLKATGWECRYALAKGRGRYLCPLRLELCLEAEEARDAGHYLFEDELDYSTDVRTVKLYRDMADALEKNAWLGDRDAWPETIPARAWQPLTVDRRQCAGRKCRLVRQCCFYNAREGLDEADCIVANHHLVLADLSLGGGAILSPPEDTIYVFDEGHRLADTALRQFAGQCRLGATRHWLELSRKSLAARGDFTAHPAFGDIPKIQENMQRVEQLLVLLEPPLQQLLEGEESGRHGDVRYRFPGGDTGEELRLAGAELAAAWNLLAAAVEDLVNRLGDALERNSGDFPRIEIEQFYQLAGGWQTRVEGQVAIWQAMVRETPKDEMPYCRWLEGVEGAPGQMDIQVNVSPINAGGLLQEHLWRRCAGAVVTSATLRALGNFDRFIRAAGTPPDATYRAVAGAFDFQRAGVLSIPDIGADGGDSMAHTEALAEVLPGIIDKSEATLMLFTSQWQMEEVHARLPDDLSGRILMQGRLSNAEIIRRHRQRVDAGEGSIIFGLNSFAEGIDLPGDYCRHVVLAKLPFAVPDDPVQASLAEWIEARGGNAFIELTLPDAALRLVQHCGRLLRSETDSGRITLLDRRILTRRYGRQLLDDLPPFQRDFG